MMKMITIEVTALIEDDKEGWEVQKDVNDSLAHFDEADELKGYEWYNVEVTSERPYAVEE